ARERETIAADDRSALRELLERLLEDRGMTVREQPLAHFLSRYPVRERLRRVVRRQQIGDRGAETLEHAGRDQHVADAHRRTARRERLKRRRFEARARDQRVERQAGDARAL